MTESQFWAVYFALVDQLLVRDQNSEAAEGNGEIGGGQSPDRASNAARSGLSGWEAVQHEDAASRPPSSPVADAAGDDLDAYLKVCPFQLCATSLIAAILQTSNAFCCAGK